MSDIPKRIQRKRSKGWRMPDGAVYVGRPTVFGNPFSLWTAPSGNCDPRYGVLLYRMWLEPAGLYAGWIKRALCFDKAPLTATAKIDQLARHRETIVKHLEELRGKDLACWCGLDQPCHADTLLELANQPKAAQ